MPPRVPFKYTAADIARYHNGGMSATEMHALEKAALEDPFLSDAIEGYTYTKTGVKDVHVLKQQVQKRTQKIHEIHNNRRLLLSIAALLILLVGFGWLATKLANRNETGIAVQKETSPRSKQPPVPQAGATDSNTTSTGPAITKTNRVNAGKDTAIAEKQMETNTPGVETPDVKNETAVSRKDETDSQTFSNAHAAEAPLSKTKNAAAARHISEDSFKARVVDEQHKGVPNAKITDPQHHEIATTDAAGNFSIAAPDSQLTVAVISPGFLFRQTTLSPADSATTIVLQPATTTLHKSVKVEAAEPLAGWNRFQAYINKNLVLPKEGESLSGVKEVVLSFDVDTSGNAVNIVIDKPLCHSCDSVAVRVIREGTKWKKTKKAGKATAQVLY